jgi:hypothetical protein
MFDVQIESVHTMYPLVPLWWSMSHAYGIGVWATIDQWFQLFRNWFLPQELGVVHDQIKTRWKKRNKKRKAEKPRLECAGDAQDNLGRTVGDAEGSQPSDASSMGPPGRMCAQLVLCWIRVRPASIDPAHLTTFPFFYFSASLFVPRSAGGKSS